MADAPDIARIARIARLHLTPEEERRFAVDAQAILAHFEAVMAAQGAPATGDLPGVPPRPDEAAPPDPAQVEGIVGQFPRKDGRHAKAPGGL